MSELVALIGLGNPGADYAQTRHNAGFWWIDALARDARVSLRPEAKFHSHAARASLGGRDVLLVQPQTFMNRSGQAVQAIAQFYKIAPGNLLIAHDELDLSPGTVRLKLGGGHGGHNGLRSIHAALGAEYRRLRIGLGHPGDRAEVLNYVLGRPGREDDTAIADALTRASMSLNTWLTKGWEQAMTQLHTQST
jgi:peptidyl-tRNA hydrolase, PTH1 family